jgi:hypothetical protein
LKSRWTSINVAEVAGSTPPGTRLFVRYRGHDHPVLADENGWWAFVQEAPADRDDDETARAPTSCRFVRRGTAIAVVGDCSSA